MAKNIAMSMLKFADGVAKNVMPKTHAKSISKMGAAAAKELSSSMAFKNGDIIGKGLLKNGVTSGTANTIKNMNQGIKFGQAIKGAHSVGGKYVNGVYQGGKLSAGKIAGSVATVGIAGRVATGGGLYRDRYGNFNIPGVPFI